MRKIIVSEFVSLDGVMENPQWTMEYNSGEQEKYKFDELKDSDSLLLGRVCYEEFAAVWPGMIEDTGEYGVMMNTYRKYVVSTTLDKAEWDNSCLIQENIAEELTRIKQEPGRNILVFGSCTLVQTLIQHNLVDEYRLMVFPVIVGSGKRLFREGLDQKALKLTDTKTFDSGVVVLTYQPA